MLDNLSRYVYEVYRCKSVSAASKKLFVSQPALSTSIKKAERELGAPIFNRSTLPFSLTPEGEVYIKAIEEVLKIEEEAKSRILDIGETKSGTLTIGTATHLSFFAIPIICERFKDKYPNIDINIVLSDTKTLPTLLEKNSVDLIFTSSDESCDRFITDEIFEEKCIVAISKNYKGIEHLREFALSYEQIITRTYPSEKEIADLDLFANVEFIYSPPNSNLYKRRKMFFGDSGISRHITSSSARFQLNYNLMKAGFGALFTTDSIISTTTDNDDCLYFAINSPDATRSFSIVHRSGEASASAKITEEFILTAKELFSTNDHLALFSHF